MDFPEFFREATRSEPRPYFDPYPYQVKLANTPIVSRALRVPTGAGKTAAAILPWLYRLKRGEHDTPRRLVYCLPMRVLVEQTRDYARKWTARVAQDVRVATLMGGEVEDKWEIHPEKPFILIGTQDMLLSRALNRGYAMSPSLWPVHFGLLNNDCLWICDEIQGMANGLATIRQLEAFWGEGRFGTAKRSYCWYMSATSGDEVLKTRDNQTFGPDFFFELKPEDLKVPRLFQAISATKSVEVIARKMIDSTDEIIAEHERMLATIPPLDRAGKPLARRTIIICNTVDSALAIYEAIAETGRRPLVLHGRFRGTERRSQMASLENMAEGIVVCTQVIEAGLDLSSAALWSEAAPLAQVVQRLGRLNRAGEFGIDGEVAFEWTPCARIVQPSKLPDKPERKTRDVLAEYEKKLTYAYLPYDRAACEHAWQQLRDFRENAGPWRLLQEFKGKLGLKPADFSLRTHELLDFFDTDSNLSLGYTDVSPFVRTTDPETDVYVFWRPREDLQLHEFDVQRDELCPVPVWKVVREFRPKSARVWRGQELGWQPAGAELFAGATVFLDSMEGGYLADLGWTGKRGETVPSCYIFRASAPSDEDLLSRLERHWQAIGDHTADVKDVLTTLIERLGLDNVREGLLNAALWHDFGKAHPTWQAAVRQLAQQARLEPPAGAEPFAKFAFQNSPLLVNKSGEDLKKQINRLKRTFRPGLRHEVASALCLRSAHREAQLEPTLEETLAEYIVMSHHGYVRKFLRDPLPKDPDRNNKGADEVRGVAEGDKCPAVEILGQRLGPVEHISIESRQLGRCTDGSESWTRSVLRLLDHYGPFRLAYYEAVFRAADRRASKEPKSGLTEAAQGT